MHQGHGRPGGQAAVDVIPPTSRTVGLYAATCAVVFSHELWTAQENVDLRVVRGGVVNEYDAETRCLVVDEAGSHDVVLRE